MSETLFIPLSDSSEDSIKRKAEQIFKFIKSKACYSVDDFVGMIVSMDSNCFSRKFFAIEDQTLQSNNNTIEVEPMYSNVIKNSFNNIVFMFPGQGLEYYKVGKILYDKYNSFRSAMDSCFEEIKKIDGQDLKNLLYQSESKFSEKKTDILVTSLITFSFEYSFAILLISFGIMPSALVGYSIGEYVAATLSGIFSLKNAVALVHARGMLLKKMEPGSMLSVPETSTKIMSLLSSTKVSLAADHGTSCVVSGSKAEISKAEMILKKKRIITQYMNIDRAGHSYMLDPLLTKFEKSLKVVDFSFPKLPLIAAISGKWQIDEMTKPDYWVKQLRQTVQFDKSINTLLNNGFEMFIEVGIGNTLTVLTAQKKLKKTSSCVAVNLIKDQFRTDIREWDFFIYQLARMWVRGLDVNWLNVIVQGNERVENQKTQDADGGLLSKYYPTKLSAKRYYLLKFLPNNATFEEAMRFDKHLIVFTTPASIDKENDQKQKKATTITVERNLIHCFGKTLKVLGHIQDIKSIFSKFEIEFDDGDAVKMVWVCECRDLLINVGIVTENYTLFLLLKKMCEQIAGIKHCVVFRCYSENIDKYLDQVARLYNWAGLFSNTIQIVLYSSKDFYLDTNAICIMIGQAEHMAEEKVLFYHADDAEWYSVRTKLFLPV